MLAPRRNLGAPHCRVPSSLSPLYFAYRCHNCTSLSRFCNSSCNLAIANSSISAWPSPKVFLSSARFCILHGHTGISADMALRLAEALGTSPELWLGMQSSWALWQEQQKPRPHVEKLLIR
ncbi:HigA family addiction module antitoxin [Chromobacterium vaccinii]|uniref:HigA family addiction module antitoxin n=1 Tax=Chromobacterium vaccinii TaxID=1108595 RepID=UPI002285F05F|nr:HigA family addiction module antitoxin [Chromobacterium vaccinii]